MNAYSAASNRCRACGCGDFDPCLGEDLEFCHWVEPELCSVCSTGVLCPRCKHFKPCPCDIPARDRGTTFLAVAFLVVALSPFLMSATKPHTGAIANLPGGYDALCEIVPGHDPTARMVSHCSVQSDSHALRIRYTLYPGADIPTAPLNGAFVRVVHSREHVESVMPFERVEIAGWGQTIIFPVSLDRQALWMTAEGQFNTDRRESQQWVIWKPGEKFADLFVTQ